MTIHNHARGAMIAAALLWSAVGCSQDADNTQDMSAAASASEATAAGQDDGWRQPLFEGLGGVDFQITTSSPKAQQYFNQGMALAWGFNHAASDFAFVEATMEDPDCAMCKWGSALVLGPNINANMAEGNYARARVLAERAHELAMANGSEVEQALTTALLERYTAEAPEDRSALDEAYADAMRDVASQFPEHVHAQALMVESLMNLHPWDFWTKDGAAQPWTPEIIDGLENTLAMDPDHTGAIHLYIHASEQSQTPEQAEPYADKLAGLAPAAGHLVHMPAHIYMRVGRYHDSTLNNMKATDADSAFISACRSNSPIYLAGYVPHNWHFGWVTAAIEGWSEQAFAMAQGTADQLSDELLRAPGMGVAQHFLMQPAFAQVRFGAWDEILAAPEPDADFVYARGIWHYARGRAFTSMGQLDAAQAELDAVETIRSSEALNSMSFFTQEGRGGQILEIANLMLAGELAAARGDLDAATTILSEAVAAEDAMPYNEPPDWFYPARHSLGVVQLQAGDAAGAEATYREDLEHMKDNGWALLGLSQALRAQGKDAEADEAHARFEAAWQHADTEITASRI